MGGLSRFLVKLSKGSQRCFLAAFSSTNCYMTMKKSGMVAAEKTIGVCIRKVLVTSLYTGCLETALRRADPL